jgi:spore germination cell wall hydrolase CwlJ-like protein
MLHPHGSWALGTIASWCLGIAIAFSIAADAGEEISSGTSLAPLAWRMAGPPAELIPPQPSGRGVDSGSFAGEAGQILQQASLSLGASGEFKRLPDEIEPRADMKRHAQKSPVIDRSRRGDPLAGLRPAFDTRLRNFPALARLRAGRLLFRHDDFDPASSFSATEEALGPESVAAFEPWLEGESPATAQSFADVSPAQRPSPETVRLAAVSERLMQGVTPAVLRAVALGSTTPAAADSTPIEAVALPQRWPGSQGNGEGLTASRSHYAALLDPNAAAREQRCLAEAIYFEARGEPETGQAAVAQVVLNRARSGIYPQTICGVVYQNRRRYHACQFSFACGGKPPRINEPGAWDEAQRIAAGVTSGSTYLSGVGSSTHFHANYVRPRWARRLEKSDVIGHHIFYKLKPGQS